MQDASTSTARRTARPWGSTHVKSTSCPSVARALNSTLNSGLGDRIPLRVVTGRLRRVVVVGGKRIRQRGRTSASPNQDVSTSPTGHVAKGPWSGPYQTHPAVVADGSGELPATLFLDSQGSGHFSLEDVGGEGGDPRLTAALQSMLLSDCEAVPNAPPAVSNKATSLGTSASPQPRLVRTRSAPMHAGPAALPAAARVLQELALTQQKRRRTASLHAAAGWPAPHERGDSQHGGRLSAGGAKHLYNVQQPRGRNMS